MEQKFVKFEEAVEKLGVSAETLNELRERGELRAYRDGSSWKFRSDEIERLVQEGIPEPPPPSDIGLVQEDDLIAAEPLESDGNELELELDNDDEDTEISKSSPMLKQDDSQLEPELGDTDAMPSGSELELADLEDTVPAGASDLDLDKSDQPGDSSDSILLSEEELGESVGPHASTIIGKSELEDADLELALDDQDVHSVESDVKLAPSSGASDVHSPHIASSGVLDAGAEEGSGSAKSAFEGLEELEIDLAAESSRILSPEDLEKTPVGEKPSAALSDDSDLRLDDEDQPDSDSEMGSTDVPLPEIEEVEEAADDGSGSEIELSTEDDLVLDDGSGSDITLDSGDSGINLGAPSDSGLALDDIPLDIGGSAILSSLSLSGDSDPEISLVGGDSPGEEEGSAALQTDDDFQLTPLSEGTQEADGDSSSQVIALDADIEELGESAVGQFEDVDLSEEAGDAVVLTEDLSEGAADQLDMGYAPAPSATAAADEMQYGWAGMLLLCAASTFLLLCGVMMLDMIRNIWTWNESFGVSSSLLDALLGLFGLQ